MSGKTRLSIASLGVIAAIGILFAVLPAFGSSDENAIRLHMSNDGQAFTFTGLPDQPIETTPNGKRSCEVKTTTANFGSLITPTGRNGGQLPVGNVDFSLGVKSGGSNSNGSPCSQVQQGEYLKLALGNSESLAGRTFDKARLDIEMTSDAVVRVEFSDGSSSEVYYLETGTSIVNTPPGTAVFIDDNPLTADSTFGGGRTVDASAYGGEPGQYPGDAYACIIANSSGSNNLSNDNCIWTIDPTLGFTSVELTVVQPSNGSVSLEGSHDWGGDTNYDTLFYLTNAAPDAVDDFTSTGEDNSTTVDVLFNDTDPDGDELTVTSFTQGEFGSVSRNGPLVTYTPDLNRNGEDSFEYTISDGNGGTATATVTVTVSAANDAPVAFGSEQSIDEDGSLTLAPSQLGSDPDCDVSPLDPDCTEISLEILTSPTSGSAVIVDGNIVYTPNPDFYGTDSFTYRVCDPSECSVGSATVNVTVLAGADDDVAYIDVPAQTSVVIDVLANDGPPLAVYDESTLATAEVGFTIPTVKGGTATLLVDEFGYQTLSYEPPPDPSTGQPALFESDIFDYSVWDPTGSGPSQSATVTVFELFDCGETLTVSDGQVTASYTRAAEEGCLGKPYLVDIITTGLNLPTVRFQPRPQGGEPVEDCSQTPEDCTAEFTAELSFVPRTPANGPDTGVLEYDPVFQADPADAVFRQMQWCEYTPIPGSQEVGESIAGALPLGESWCIYEVTTIIDPDDPTTTRTLWKAAGIGDPLKRVS